MLRFSLNTTSILDCSYDFTMLSWEKVYQPQDSPRWNRDSTSAYMVRMGTHKSDSLYSLWDRWHGRKLSLIFLSSSLDLYSPHQHYIILQHKRMHPAVFFYCVWSYKYKIIGVQVQYNTSLYWSFNIIGLLILLVVTSCLQVHTVLVIIQSTLFVSLNCTCSYLLSTVQYIHTVLVVDYCTHVWSTSNTTIAVQSILHRQLYGS